MNINPTSAALSVLCPNRLEQRLLLIRIRMRIAVKGACYGKLRCVMDLLLNDESLGVEQALRQMSHKRKEVRRLQISESLRARLNSVAHLAAERRQVLAEHLSGAGSLFTRKQCQPLGALQSDTLAILRLWKAAAHSAHAVAFDLRSSSNSSCWFYDPKYRLCIKGTTKDVARVAREHLEKYYSLYTQGALEEFRVPYAC